MAPCCVQNALDWEGFVNRVVQVYLNEMFRNDVPDIGVESQEKHGVVVIEGDPILISERLCDKEETPVVLHDISLIVNMVLSRFVQKLLEALLCVPRGGGSVGDRSTEGGL